MDRLLKYGEEWAAKAFMELMIDAEKQGRDRKKNRDRDYELHERRFRKFLSTERST